VEDPERDGIVTHVREGPDPGHGEEVDGNGEKDEVGAHQDEDVEEPEPTAVHVVGVGVFVAVASCHHHSHDKVDCFATRTTRTHDDQVQMMITRLYIMTWSRTKYKNELN
jgi:hypothetical protein